MQHEETLELRSLLAVIRRWAWLIAGCTLLASAIAFAITTRMPPAYEATTTLLVLPSDQKNMSEYNTLIAGERLALTYGQMLKEQSTLQTAIARLGLAGTPDDLAKKITVTPVESTQLIRVTARDASAAQAARLANMIADIFTEHTKALQQDRYRNDILARDAKAEALRKTVAETQAQIDAASARQIADETELTRLEGLLADYRSASRTLQEDYQALQLLVEQLQDNIKIVEPAPEPAIRASEPTLPGAWTPYTATAMLLVGQGGIDQGTDVSGVLASERLAATYAEMMTGASVLKAAIAKLGSRQTPEALAAMVRAEPIAGTQLVQLQVTGTDAQETTRQANAIAEAFVDHVRGMLEQPYADRMANMDAGISRLSTLIDDVQAAILTQTATKLSDESELAQLRTALSEYRSDYRAAQQDAEQLHLTAAQAPGTIVIAQRAEEPPEPARNLMVYVALAALIALLVAFGIVFLIEYLDESIKTPDDAVHLLGLSTVGTIERFKRTKKPLIVASQPQSPVAEAYRALAANVRLASREDHLRTILVTSPAPAEGKSVVAANLAVAMANAGQRVVAVEADLRLPRLHQLFDLDREGGLADALQGEGAAPSLKSTAVEGVKVLSSGALTRDPVGLLSSPRMKQLLAACAEEADFVIIDSPPVLAAADTTILAAGADGVLLVLQSGHTRRQPAQRAVEALRQTKTRLIGVVLNAVPVRSEGYYRYYSRPDKTAAHLPGK